MSLPNAYNPEVELSPYLSQVLSQHIEQLKQQQNPFLVPYPEPIPSGPEWQHFHLSPEMFIQIGGSTQFSFPNQQLSLMPGQIIILPRQLAHQELMSDGKETFCNIVIIAYMHRLSYHITVRDVQDPRGVRIIKFERIRSPRAQTITAAMDEIVAAHYGDFDFGPEAVQSYSIGLLSTLHNLIQTRPQHEEGINAKVIQCLDYIDYHIGNTLLSVNLLANWLGCHPDYLSKLFHQEQGVRLNSYISEKRIELAKDNLQLTDLSISQIATSIGFQDPAYFSRIFKKRVGSTPQTFRNTALPT